MKNNGILFLIKKCDKANVVFLFVGFHYCQTYKGFIDRLPHRGVLLKLVSTYPPGTLKLEKRPVSSYIPCFQITPRGVRWN